MRRLSSLLVAGLILQGVFPASSLAVTSSTTVIRLDVSQDLQIPGCTEVVRVEGHTLFTLHITSHDDGSYARHSTQVTTLHGVGLDSGAHYRALIMEASPESQQANGVESNQTIQHVRITRLGPPDPTQADGFVAREVVHYTVSGTGVFIQTHDFRATECL